MADFVAAVQELYQAPVAQFVAERKRLADELKAAGDAAGAKQLLARKRPTISAWVINQLYWHARDTFDELLATADKLRKSSLKDSAAASAAHRDVIARLRQRAATLLQDAGHAPTESTLRRVGTTLTAIAVANGFDPDPPGALAEDRDPPGFAAFGIAAGTDEEVAAPPAAKAKKKPADSDAAEDADAKNADETAAERKARERAEREAEKEREKREEAEKKRITAERHRLETALRTAKAGLHDREREVKQLEKQLEKANKSVEEAREIVDDLDHKLDDLRDS